MRATSLGSSAQDVSAQGVSAQDASVQDASGNISVLTMPQMYSQGSQDFFEGNGSPVGSSMHDSTDIMIETACLELSELPLHKQIYEFGSRLIAAGIKELKLLPIFLMAGVHVMEDLPEEIAVARELLGKKIQLTLCDHLGSHPDISAVLGERLASVPAERSLLVAHGSRRPKGNKGIEQLAKRLDTQIAYWSVPPDIETQVIDLMQQGYQKLAILPYFLFAGGITDAITHRTEELAERFPKVQFRLLPTLGATDEVARLSVDIMMRS
ncbi:MAG: sirohydrochlorin chelatase [Cyanobacteria bacterium P01_C01_bin.69]